MTLTYSGTVIPIITSSPQWREKVSFGPNYDTFIMEALDLSEERQQRRPRPLYSIGFSILTLSAQEMGYLRAVVELAEAMPVGVPVWPMRTKLTANASAGGTTLTVDATDNCLWEVFKSYALIWQDFDSWEVVQLTSVASLSISLAVSLVSAWNAGCYVIPLMFGNLKRDQAFDQLTDEAASYQVDFQETFNLIGNQS